MDYSSSSSILIDNYLRGVIEATDGSLCETSVGFGSITSAGFTGSNYDPSNFDILGNDLNPPGLVDSVIRASEEITDLEVARMQYGGRSFPPRVESPFIASMVVGDIANARIAEAFEGGIISSGDENDPYTNIGSAIFLQTESQAEVFANDFSRFDILADHGGTIRIPALGVERVLRVGGKITQVPSPDDSRSPVPFGKIWVENDEGKTGQVTINAAASTLTPDQTFWDGSVDVGPVSGSPPTPSFRFSTDSSVITSAQELAPFYHRDMPSIGYGAMGLVPFGVHCRHSGPVGSGPYADNGPNCDEPVPTLQSELSRLPGRVLKRVEITFYGPVYTDWPLGATSGSPLIVERYNPSTSSWVDFSGKFWMVASRTPEVAFNRQITLYAWPAINTQTMLPRGDYRVRLGNGAYSVYCDWILDPSTPVEVASNGVDRVLAEFSLISDCDGDGEADDPSECLTTHNGRCPADLDNGSGTGTVDDAVTIDDMLFFLEKFEDGDLAADVDDGTGSNTRDNAVTIDDLLFFLLRFEAGC